MIRRRAPLKRSTKPIARRGRPRARRPGGPRRGPAGIPAKEWRNPGYLDFLREEGLCVACAAALKQNGRVGLANRRSVNVFCVQCDPAHGPVNGKGSKGPDAGAIPMCRTHHDEQTEIHWPAFEAKYGFSREREASVWFAAFQIWKEHQCLTP